MPDLFAHQRNEKTMTPTVTILLSEYENLKKTIEKYEMVLEDKTLVYETYYGGSRVITENQKIKELMDTIDVLKREFAPKIRKKWYKLL